MANIYGFKIDNGRERVMSIVPYSSSKSARSAAEAYIEKHGGFTKANISIQKY